MSAVGIIPARYASTRFPGKPLAEIAGIPMIQRVWERARCAKRLRTVIIATDDERIADCCHSFGAPVAMTSSDHATGTDRLAEAARDLDDDIIVNIQGDEPLIESSVIDATVEVLLEDDSVPMATVAHVAPTHSLDDPNRVKVVLDRNGVALYFSRSAIPHPRRAMPGLAPLQHIGLYAYRREFLFEFVALERTPAEQTEELEQLRALENGHRIRVAVIDDWGSISVDVPADIALVEEQLATSSSGSPKIAN
jgi:3-deoxy-manno-octulosonate cytidylyltransferase (CMP-KDO synthetase)